LSDTVASLTPVRARAGRAGMTSAEGVHNAADVYRELAPAVLAYLRSQHVDDSDDALGEVFYGVARDIHRFRGDHSALRRWVFTIAHHRLVDQRRRRTRRPEELRAEPPEQTSPPCTPARLDPDLVEALGALTPDQREVITLRFVADLPIRDVARITRRRIGAVKALQYRGLDALERILGGDSR